MPHDRFTELFLFHLCRDDVSLPSTSVTLFAGDTEVWSAVRNDDVSESQYGYIA